MFDFILFRHFINENALVLFDYILKQNFGVRFNNQNYSNDFVFYKSIL